MHNTRKPILSKLTEISSEIVVAEVVALSAEIEDENGVVEQSALLSISESLKGNLLPPEKIALGFNKFFYLKNQKGKRFTEKEKFVLGGKYIFFITEDSGTVHFSEVSLSLKKYALVDRWLGSYAYNEYLEAEIKQIIKIK